MDITYFGHSSFRLKGKSASLVTDPFDPEMVGLKYPKKSADLVTVSHDHKDHSRSDLVRNAKMVIDGPGEYEIMGVSIIGIQVHHDDKKGDERGKNTIFLYEIDGLRLAHLGDLGHKLSDEIVESLGALNVLMIPVGGVYTIDPKTAAEVVRAIEPSIVIPMHYKMKGMKEAFGKLSTVEDFLKEVEMSVERVDKLTLKKGDLLEGESKVIILNPKT